MRIEALVMVAAGMTVHAGEVKQADPNMVKVYVEYGVAPLSALSMATKLAAKMFATADVRIRWQFGEPTRREREHDRPIVVSISSGTPPSERPGALAYALPYQGVQIRVFYDRIAAAHPQGTHTVLAHVMVHEITHILQGVSRHSESGVMKANWTSKEYDAMLDRPLPFTVDDIVLIRIGLGARGAMTSAHPIQSDRP